MEIAKQDNTFGTISFNTSTTSSNFNSTVSTPQFIVTGESKVDQKGISVKLYFTYVKKKFGALSQNSFDNRIKKIEKFFNDAVDNGQVALSEELMEKITKEMRESVMYAKGYKIFIEKEHLEKFQYKIKDKNISITKIKNYTGLIPKEKELEIRTAIKNEIFDDIVIVHYDGYKDKKSRKTKEEIEKDPIAFGKIKESNRYYFICDWLDEYCDLTLDNIIDEININQKDMKLTRQPNFNIK